MADKKNASFVNFLLRTAEIAIDSPSPQRSTRGRRLMRKSPSLKTRTQNLSDENGAIIRIVINRPAGVDPGDGAELGTRNPLVNCHRQADGKV